jgi:hypothetical protein
MLITVGISRSSCLLTNATVIDDAIRFVPDKQNVQSKDKAVAKCKELDRVKIIENGVKDIHSQLKIVYFKRSLD